MRQPFTFNNNPAVRSTMPERIEKALDGRRLTIEQVAKILGVHPSTVGHHTSRMKQSGRLLSVGKSPTKGRHQEILAVNHTEKKRRKASVHTAGKIEDRFRGYANW